MLLTLRQKDPRPERAYELRAEGHRWAEVGEIVGCTDQAARARARAWAAAHDLPWPVKVLEDGERPYRLALSGMSWTRVAERMGLPYQIAWNRARRYALEHGRPWPLREKNPGAAYDLWANGLRGPELARDLGYKDYRSCLASMRQFAQSRGLPWPPKKGVYDPSTHSPRRVARGKAHQRR